MTGGHIGLERISRIRERLMPMGDELVRRAHASGRLRADIEASDLPLIQAIMGPLVDASMGIEPELYRRYLGIMLRGIATQPDEEPPLAVAALDIERAELIMFKAKRPGQRSGNRDSADEFGQVGQRLLVLEAAVMAAEPALSGRG